MKRARLAVPGRCSFGHERVLWTAGVRPVAGVDEAGRGPLAGPVVAAAVVFVSEETVDGLDDSKKLSPARREALYDLLTGAAFIRWSVAAVGPEDIDRLNILGATHAAMARALAGLAGVGHALVDGLPARGLPVPHTALVGGDSRSFSIAAASIIAKVTRDRIMERADAAHPLYGFRRHKGYPTAAHLSNLRIHGPSPIHRKSFAPVAQGSFAL
jgi:ribonuclease HII